MIYLFTGNNIFALEEEIKKWKSVFIEKYGDFNLVHIREIGSIDVNFLSETLLANSFF
jgi:DNA polymerase III delta subunit